MKLEKEKLLDDIAKARAESLASQANLILQQEELKKGSEENGLATGI